jgi:hypothetical protein
MSNTINILIISDRKPGHLSQSRGLAKWLSKSLPVQVTELDCELRLKPVSRLVLPHLLRFPPVKPRFLNLFYIFDSRLLKKTKPDLIISAGGDTSFLNIALARQFGVHNIFMGSKRRLRSYHFSLHLTLEPTNERNNVTMLFAPSLIDTDSIRSKGINLRNKLNLRRDQQLYLLAFGGDSKGIHYTESDIQGIAKLMNMASKESGVKWLITTSRRTGPYLERSLKENIPSQIVADAVWWSEKPKKIMEDYIGAANRLFISGDSMSMIAEAISSEKIVTILTPEHYFPDKRFLAAVERYEKHGLATTISLNDPESYRQTTSSQLLKVRKEKQKLVSKIKEILLNPPNRY